MSKEITSDILNKINQIKQKKTDKENSTKPVDPFMGFDISKEGLSQFKKSKESNFDNKFEKENFKDNDFKLNSNVNINNSNSNSTNVKAAINDMISKEGLQPKNTSK